MTEPRRLIEIGILPAGADSFFVAEGSADPVAIMLREADERLARERLAVAKAKAAKLADIARVKNTRRARAAQRFKRALSMFRGG
jgi:predicted RNA-binding Zn ribbon-like protein